MSNYDDYDKLIEVGYKEIQSNNFKGATIYKRFNKDITYVFAFNESKKQVGMMGLDDEQIIELYNEVMKNREV